jgi:esterase/lipase superfamily enzyme
MWRSEALHIAYHKRDSAHLGRPMEFKVYGHAGRPFLVFPTSNGRFYQYEDSGAIAALSGFIEAGQIRVWTVDGIDGETFFARSGDLQARLGRHEAYFRYVREELLPEIMQVSAAANGGQMLRPLLSGCSMGAFHASNFLFRFPELAAGVIALSGVYSTRHFFGEALDGSVYFNSPLAYLGGLQDEGILARIRSRRLFFCCGQGAWEEPMLIDTRQLDHLLRDKHIPAWVDFWGSDVSHDWPWWHRQIVYFVNKWLEDDRASPVG